MGRDWQWHWCKEVTNSAAWSRQHTEQTEDPLLSNIIAEKVLDVADDDLVGKKTLKTSLDFFSFVRFANKTFRAGQFSVWKISCLPAYGITCCFSKWKLWYLHALCISWPESFLLTLCCGSRSIYLSSGILISLNAEYKSIAK